MKFNNPKAFPAWRGAKQGNFKLPRTAPQWWWRPETARLDPFFEPII
jgi:hypothetical protein